ncbi:MAG: group 1 truncated hemoglobin [Proteobacteria bacterium]|nr:group 1 truncated hemoglobin [Pseudomonadota bacterium]
MKLYNWFLLGLRAVVLTCAMAVAHASGTLYEQIGGEAKFRAIAQEFTNAILADDRINFTFADADVKKFTQLIFEQLCNLTGGPCKYTGRDMHEAHAKLAINNAQFNAIAEDLYIAFDRVHVPYRLQNKVMVMLAPMQRDIVKPGFVAPGTTPPPR